MVIFRCIKKTPCTLLPCLHRCMSTHCLHRSPWGGLDPQLDCSHLRGRRQSQPAACTSSAAQARVRINICSFFGCSELHMVVKSTFMQRTFCPHEALCVSRSELLQRGKIPPSAHRVLQLRLPVSGNKYPL